MTGRLTSNALRAPEGLHDCEAVRDDAIVVWMVWVYLLRCSDGPFYVGHTSDRSHATKLTTKDVAALTRLCGVPFESSIPNLMSPLNQLSPHANVS
jgi:hypothetical protein